MLLYSACKQNDSNEFDMINNTLHVPQQKLSTKVYPKGRNLTYAIYSNINHKKNMYVSLHAFVNALFSGSKTIHFWGHQPLEAQRQILQGMEALFKINRQLYRQPYVMWKRLKQRPGSKAFSLFFFFFFWRKNCNPRARHLYATEPKPRTQGLRKEKDDLSRCANVVLTS